MRTIDTPDSDLLNIGDCGLAIGIGLFSSSEPGLFTNYPLQWQEQYFELDGLSCDPVLVTGMRYPGWNSWDNRAPNDAFSEAAYAHGLTGGIVFSQNIGGNRMIAGLSLRKQLSETSKNRAISLLREYHYQDLALKAHSLSKPQKELVFLFANGLRAKQVAAHFGTSEAAIKQRKLAIQKSIGVSSFLVVINICSYAGLTIHPIK
ncbi:autoinducer binding domain-containing protein [Roseibium litorale]|uniref:Autoinducer binding domain-containing protein n=1 Tax=Roseibium litorale TaxID=2803841 RepID=A0ABR9CT22_9HYPH|nr:autoinducer binding domain-containing protein [Roseibium litorale]MBD8894023.1 autoinducer binding domain-containing protein [Roseibium litorale]